MRLQMLESAANKLLEELSGSCSISGGKWQVEEHHFIFHLDSLHHNEMNTEMSSYLHALWSILTLTSSPRLPLHRFTYSFSIHLHIAITRCHPPIGHTLIHLGFFSFVYTSYLHPHLCNCASPLPYLVPRHLPASSTNSPLPVCHLPPSALPHSLYLVPPSVCQPFFHCSFSRLLYWISTSAF